MKFILMIVYLNLQHPVQFMEFSTEFNCNIAQKHLTGSAAFKENAAFAVCVEK